MLRSSFRYSQYQYDYTYSTTAMNSNAGSYTLVEGAITSSSPNTVVLEPTVFFGNVPGNSSASSRTTFTIRQDRRYPFDPASLTWTFTGSASSTDLGTTPSAVSLAASSNSASYGTGIDLTAIISPATGTGTVTFYDMSTPIGTATVSGGVATLSGFMLPIGIHTIRATYGGDTTYSSSDSGQSTVTVSTGGAAAACEGQSQTAEMDCLANAFLGTLTSTQQTAVQYSYTLQNVTRWSNLPVGAVPRNGLRFGDLTSTQLAAVLTLLRPILSAEGLQRLQLIRGADETISPLGGSIMWGAANYYIALYGTPSTTTPWMLQISGHHYDLNRTFNGPVIGVTPFFIGSDPPAYIVQDTLYAPLAKQFLVMNALGRTLVDNTDAQLSGTFDDVVIGPDQDVSGTVTWPRTYPTGTSNRGVLASSLPPEQQAQIRSAIEAWVNDHDPATAAQLLGLYEDPTNLADTYVGYSGTGTLTKLNDYIRIDGPRVWIEMSAQSAGALPNEFHYHTIWRDKLTDYGGEFSSQ